jgi:hypothetical protein
LGASVLAARFFTLFLKGVSRQVPANQSTRKGRKNINTAKQTQNMKHRGTMTNENMTHVFQVQKLKHRNLEKHRNYWMNVF